MEKQELVGLDATLYTETFANGFSLYMIPFSNKKNYSMTYATRYGSDILEFKMKGNKKRTVPSGIAHFLEHKMFEQEDGEDPFVYFGKSGTDANAATDHEYTKYICTGTKNFKENFRYLLKYVNSPYFTDENVSKEKGIITEEINMYLDIPDFALENKIKENTYQYHPRRIDVAGTVDDVMKITKEDLYDCYRTFYQPNNMFALLVGEFDPEDALQIAKEEVANRKNELKTINVQNYKEPIEVSKKEEECKMNIQVSKVLYAVKFLRKSFPIKDKVMLRMYLQLITTILFGSSSLFRENARRDGFMNGIYFSWEEVEDIITLTFQFDTKKPNELLREVKKTLTDIHITEDEIERYKKVWIANEVRLFDYVGSTTENVFSDIITYGKPVINRIPMIRKLNKKDLDKVAEQITLTHTAEIIALPKEN